MFNLADGWFCYGDVFSSPFLNYIYYTIKDFRTILFVSNFIILFFCCKLGNVKIVFCFCLLKLEFLNSLIILFLITHIFSILICNAELFSGPVWDILINSKRHIVWILIDLSHISFHFGWNERSGHFSFSYNHLLSSFVWTSGRYYRFPGLAPFENRIGHVAIIKFYFYWYPIWSFTMLKFKRETSGTSAIIWLITEHTATDHSERFFLGTSSWTMGPAQGVQMTDLTKFWRPGLTIFANSDHVRCSSIGLWKNCPLIYCWHSTELEPKLFHMNR